MTETMVERVGDTLREFFMPCEDVCAGNASPDRGFGIFGHQNLGVLAMETGFLNLVSGGFDSRSGRINAVLGDG